MPSMLFTDDAAFDTAAKFFRLPVLSVRPWSFGEVAIAPPPDYKRAILSLREARSRVEGMAPEAATAVEHFLQADATLLNADRAEALFHAGFFVAANTFDLPEAGQVGVDQLRSIYQPKQAESLRFLDRYEDMLRLRMGTAIRLLRLRHVIESVATGGVKDPTGPAGVAQFVGRLYAGLHAMEQARGHFDTLRHAYVKAFILLFNLNHQRENQKLIAHVQPLVTQVHDEMVLVRSLLEKAAQPLDIDQGPLSITDYLLPELAPVSKVDELMTQVEHWLNGFAHLHHRMLAHLSAICAKVELTVGLPRLPAMSKAKPTPLTAPTESEQPTSSTDPAPPAA